MEKDVTYIHVKRALENTKACFLCTLEDELERKYIDTYLYELVMDASSRQKIVESRGFCNHHSYKMLIEASKPQSPDGHGMALILRSVIEQLVRDIRTQSGNVKESTEVEKELPRILPNAEKCPACNHIDEFILMYIGKFLETASAGDQELIRLFGESKGFCLPHYATVLEVALNLEKKNEQIMKMIFDVEEANLRKMDEQLAEYVKRQDYRFSEKPDEEIIFKAVSKLAGRRGVRPILRHKTIGSAVQK